MKIFDWTQVKHDPRRVLWLKANYNKPMSEKEFVKQWLAIKKEGTSPSRARNQYHNFKEFGFFN